MLFNRDRALDLMGRFNLDVIIAAAPENIQYVSGLEGWTQNIYKYNRAQAFALFFRNRNASAALLIPGQENTYAVSQKLSVPEVYLYGRRGGLHRRHLLRFFAADAHPRPFAAPCPRPLLRDRTLFHPMSDVADGVRGKLVERVLKRSRRPLGGRGLHGEITEHGEKVLRPGGPVSKPRGGRDPLAADTGVFPALEQGGRRLVGGFARPRLHLKHSGGKKLWHQRKGIGALTTFCISPPDALFKGAAARG